MMDVAREAGVSSMTVSRAFRDASTINKETRARIHQAADRLGYLYDSTAAGLSSRKTGFVAVTIPSIDNHNFAETVQGLSDGLKDSRLQLLLAHTGYDWHNEERLIRQLLTRRPEALVTTGGAHTPACRSFLETAGIPVIELWDRPDQPIDRSIGFSNASLAGLLVTHLVDSGRTRIGFIGGDTQRDTRGTDRRRGFMAAMVARGLDASRLEGAGTAPITMAESAAAFRRLKDRWPDTEAVICVSDPAAFGALSACQSAGIAVPDAMAIAGFGAYDISEVCVPSITTIDPRSYDIGSTAAGLILDVLSTSDGLGRADGVGASLSAERHIEMPTSLVVRQSTGPNGKARP